MNSKSILLAATLAGGLLSSATVSSAAVVLSDLTISSTQECTAPAPVKVVYPTGISRRFEGQTVHLSLTIDESGRPRHIALMSGYDQDLVAHLLPAVARWRFAPAMKNGRAVAVKVELPVELIDIRTF